MIYDISYCQKGLNLKDLKPCEKVIIRLGITDHMDTFCKIFIKEAIANDIPFELYWYVTSTNAKQAVKEAQALCANYSQLMRGTYKRECRVWLDIEEEKTLNNFDDVFKAFHTVLAPAKIVYGLYSFLAPFRDKRIDVTKPWLKYVPLWLAWWKTTPTNDEILSKVGRLPEYWQQGLTKVKTNGKFMDVDYNVHINVEVTQNE